MTITEIEETIKNQTINLPNSGIDRWPGYFIFLDEDQIIRKEKLLDIKVLGWYDFKKKGFNQNVGCFIIQISSCEVIVLDHFFEVVDIWKYLLNKYPA